MQFNSYIFIMAFFPIMFILYFVANRIKLIAGKIIIILGSCVFYVYSAGKLSIVLFASIVVNYLIYLFLVKLKQNLTAKRLILYLGVVGNVLPLLFFKYLDLIIETSRFVFDIGLCKTNITMPIAISFFTFQQIMFIVESYRGEISDISTIDYLLYILYFPKLISGPLVEPMDLIEQFNDPSRKCIDIDNIASGVRIFGYGLFKKVLLADTFGRAVAWGFGSVDEATSAELIIVMLSYAFEIYFDFSGYCDMGVGISQILNVDLPINFDSPYKSISIRDFWKRWHMSLTRFLTRYIYVPLGGSKKGSKRTIINTMIVFLVSGIWHGANYTFILWGILHGILSVIDRFTESVQKRIFEPVRWFINFAIINILWLLFAANSITEWLTMLKIIVQHQSTEVGQNLLECFELCEVPVIFNALHISMIEESVRGFGLILFFVVSFVICLIPENNYRTRKILSYGGSFLSAVLMVWSIISLAGESTFVYFGF